MAGQERKADLLAAKLKAVRDPGCVETQTGSVATNYSYNFVLLG
jgi:hypothetical protein